MRATRVLVLLIYERAQPIGFGRPPRLVTLLVDVDPEFVVEEFSKSAIGEIEDVAAAHAQGAVD